MDHHGAEESVPPLQSKLPLRNSRDDASRQVTTTKKISKNASTTSLGTTTGSVVKPPSRLPTLSRSRTSRSSAPSVSPPSLSMSSPLPDVAAHAQAAFLMTTAAAQSGNESRHPDGAGAANGADNGDNDGNAYPDGDGVFEETAPSSQASLPDVVLRDGDQNDELGSNSEPRDEEEEEEEEEDVTESESKPIEDEAEGEELDEADVLDASATSAATSSGDSDRNQDSTSSRNPTKETVRKKEPVKSASSSLQERKKVGAGAASSASVARRSIRAPTAASRRGAVGGTESSAAPSSDSAAAPDKSKAPSSRLMRPPQRGAAAATPPVASTSTTTTTSRRTSSAAVSRSAPAARTTSSTTRKPAVAGATTSSSSAGKSSGASSQGKGRASPISDRPGSPAKRPMSPALSETSSKSSVSGVKVSSSSKTSETQSTRRVRPSALRQDGHTAASKASRRLKEQKENIKSRDQNVRSMTTPRERQQKEAAANASPPKSRPLTGAATSTTSASVRPGIGKAAPINSASDGRQSKLPKSISNNSMKSSANKSEVAAKEDRLRKLEGELQLKQDLLVAKGNEVTSLEATIAASTATNDKLSAEKEGLQTELRRYSVCACGLAVVSQYFASLLGASRAQAVEARSTLMLELKSKEAQIVEIEERLGRVEMDLIRSIRDQEQCQKDMKEQQESKIELEEEYQDTVERLESEHHKNKILEDRIEEEKRENLRLETELWKIGEAMRGRDSKVDAGVNCNIVAGSSMQQEVESLKVVLEMKNEELRKIRLQLSSVSNKDQELIEAKRSVQRLEQKVEDLTAMLSSKTDQERQLHQEKQQLRVSLDREAQAKKRISMENEELIYRLSHSSLNDTLGADSLSVSLPSGGHRRTPSVTHSPPSSPMMAQGGSPHPHNIQSGFFHGMTSSAASPMHSLGSPRMSKNAKMMSRSLGPYDHDSVFQPPSTPKRKPGTPTSPIDASPIGHGKGGRVVWDTNRRSPDAIEETLGRRPPVRHSPPLSRQSPPLPRHSETTEPRSSETQTTGSVTNGKSHSDGRSVGEDEEDSKFPPAPPAVSMADSDSKNGREIFPQNPMHRDAHLMELQDHDHDHDDDTSAAVESLSEGNNGGEASRSEDRKSRSQYSDDRRRSATSGSGGRKSTGESSPQQEVEEEEDDDEEEEEVVLRRKPGRRYHDTDAEEIEEDDIRDDLDS